MSGRQIIPRGIGACDFVWTHFGFEEDDADMETRRLRQANMFGPAGYVSADDIDLANPLGVPVRRETCW